MPTLVVTGGEERPVWLGVIVLAAGVCSLRSKTLRERPHAVIEDLSTVPLVMACVLLPSAQCLIVAVVALVVKGITRHISAQRYVFNLAAHGLAMSSGRWTFYLCGGTAIAVRETPLRLASAVLVAGLASEILSTAVVGVMMHLSYGNSASRSGMLDPATVVRQIGQVCVGGLFAGLVLVAPGLLLLLAPASMLLVQSMHALDVEKRSRNDAKTGLLNTAAFYEDAERELRRAERLHTQICLLVADLDNLREINRKFGHLGGDTAIIGVATVLKRETREFDVVARFGGEEYFVLLTDTDREKAGHVAERLRRAVADEVLDTANGQARIPVTTSIGLACWTPGQSLADLIEQADRALYRAKRSGRNRGFRVAAAFSEAAVAQ